MLSLFDQPVDVVVRNACGGDTRAGFPAPRNEFAAGFDGYLDEFV